MNMTNYSRHTMLVHLMKAIGITALPLSVVAGGCGGRVVVDGSNTGSDDDGSGGIDETTGGSSGGRCELVSPASTTAPVFAMPECFPLPAAGCPSLNQAFTPIDAIEHCFDLQSVDCGPVEQGAKCCYMATVRQPPQVNCGGVPGRPFLIDSVARTAAAERADRGWAAPFDLNAEMDGADLAHLSSTEREAFARAWEADGLFEHASIATFSRVSLELLAVGAPAALVAAAHEAALDEIRHARLCFMLAQRYRGAPVAPGPFPFGGAVAVSDDLTAVAVAAAREGCIGETAAAALAGDQLARATDPAVRRALATIAADESRHAELAWRTVAWAIERGGEEVRAAVARVFTEAERHLPAFGPVPDVPEELLAAHGRLPAAAIPAAVRRTLDEVIRPCAKALLYRSLPSREPSSISAS